MTKRRAETRYLRVTGALLLSSGLSVALYGLRVLEARTLRHGFLVWNLFLAALPLVFGWWLARRLRQGKWLTGANLFLTALWLGFLPNSFYIVSDLVHLGVTGEVSLLYDAAMYSSFILNGFMVGFISVYLVHMELLRRLGRAAHGLIGAAFLACSFAVYLGRYLRWNTWDVLVNPADIILDVSDRIVHPGMYPQAFVTTGLFFLLISSLYVVVWQLAASLRATHTSKES